MEVVIILNILQLCQQYTLLKIMANDLQCLNRRSYRSVNKGNHSGKDLTHLLRVSFWKTWALKFVFCTYHLENNFF